MKKLTLLIVALLFLQGSILSQSYVMPAAISISPENATGWDELTLTFNPSLACFENGSLEGAETVAMHSAYADEFSVWLNPVSFNSTAYDGTEPVLTSNGDGTYSITFTPATYYGVSNGTYITHICAVFNNGTDWTTDGRDFDGSSCVDFYIPLAPKPDPSFTKVTEGTVVENSTISFAGAWGDYNNDGYQDLFVTNAEGENNELFKNNGDGTFTKIEEGDLPNDGGESRGCCWGDYNNDGYLDLFVANGHDLYYEDNFLYKNNGDGTFTKILEGNIVTDGGKSVSCSWADYDRDGNLDLFVTNFDNNFLYRNKGDGTFERIYNGAIANDYDYSLGCSWGDFNNDLYPDLYVANGYGGNANCIYKNLGNGQFEKLTQGLIVNNGDDTWGGSWGDFNNDGYLDVFVSNSGEPGIFYNWLYKNNKGDGTFTFMNNLEIISLDQPSQGSSWIDYNNDGYVDMFNSNGCINFLYENQGDETFIRIPLGNSAFDCFESFGNCWADIDNDGDLDLFIANGGLSQNEKNNLFINNGNSENWINISCEGVISNKSAIGTRIKLKATINGNETLQIKEISSQTGLGGQNSLRVHFGLGDASVIDSLIIKWPSGIIEIMTDIEVNQFLKLKESLLPQMGLSHSELDFTGFVNYSNAMFLTVTNIGYGELTIESIVTDNSFFTVNDTSFSLNSGESFDIEVVFLPVATEEYQGTLTITNNIEGESVVEIPLSGVGILPPEIITSPDTLFFSLLSNEIDVQSILIENIGQTTLEWNVDLLSQVSSTVLFTKNNFADWTKPINQDSISPNVCITRANAQGIFNSAQEEYYSYDSPNDTEWAYGYSADLEPDDYTIWRSAVDGNPPGMINKPISMHLISDDIYFDVLFHDWTSGGNGGGFSYTRSAPYPTWLQLAPEAGQVAPGSEQKLFVTINTTGVFGGNYEETLLLFNNDPSQPEISIPIVLDVTGIPDIEVDKNIVDFGSAYVNYTDSMPLTIFNIGTDALNISSILSDNLLFEVQNGEFSLNPKEELKLYVKYTPDAIGSDTAILTINSNANNHPELKIGLVGEAILPPEINILDDSIGADLLTGETDIIPITVLNSGASSLNFDILITNDVIDKPAIVPLEVGSVWRYFNEYEEDGYYNSYTYVDSIFDKIVYNEKTYYLVENFDYKNAEYKNLFFNKERKNSKEYDYWFGWMIDEKGNFYQSYYEEGYIEEILYMIGNPEIGIQWDATGNNDILTIVANVDIETVAGVFSNCWKVAYVSDGLTAYWYYKNGIGLVDFRIIENDGEAYESQSLIEYKNGISWISALTTEGSIEPNLNTEIEFEFDADRLFTGEYHAYINFVSNDPQTPVLPIKAYLNVTGVPNIACETSIDFGMVYVGYFEDYSLQINNTGTEILQISNITSSNSEFMVEFSEWSINPLSSEIIDVRYVPLSESVSNGTLTVFSNAHNNPEINIVLSGEGLKPPIISITPLEINESLNSGETGTRTLTISNTGESNLEWKMAIIDAADMDSFKPLKVGNTWEYIGEIYFNNEFSYDYSFTQEIIDKENVFGSDYFIYVDFYKKNPNRKQKPLSDIKEYWNGFRVDESNNFYQAFYENWKKEEYIYETKEMIGNPTVGSGWYTDDSEYQYYEIVGKEDVITSYGNFYDTWKVAFFNEYNDYEHENIFWYWKEGAGLVKKEIIQSYYGNEHKEVIELKNFNLMNPDWINTDITSGNITEGNSQQIKVHFDASNLDQNKYQAYIYIQSNDPASPQKIVPVLLDVTTSIKVNSSMLNVSIYPNPARTILNVDYFLSELETVNITIYDIYGREIKNIERNSNFYGKNNVKLKLAKVQSGVYFVSVKTNKYSVVKTFVID